MTKQDLKKQVDFIKTMRLSDKEKRELTKQVKAGNANAQFTVNFYMGRGKK